MKKNNKAFLKMALRSMTLWSMTGLQANTIYQGVSSDLNDYANWSNGIPNSGIVAEFNNTGSGQTTSGNASQFSALGILFDSNAPSYYLYNDSNTTQVFSIGSSGVVNNSAGVQEIANDSSGIGLITNAGPAGNNVYYQSYNGLPGDGGVTLLTSTDASTCTFEIGKYSTLTTHGETQLGTVTIGVSFEPDTNCALVTNGPCTIDSLDVEYGSSFTINGGDCEVHALNVGYNSGPDNYVILQSGNLILGDGSNPVDDYIFGPVSGAGGIIFNSTEPTGNGYLGFSTSASTYTGGTVLNGVSPGGMYTYDGGSLPATGPIIINSGILYLANNQTTGDLSGLGGTLEIDSPYSLTVNQINNKRFAGNILGSNTSTLTLGTTGSPTALGTLQLTGDSSAFAGNVVVNSGNLQVNNKLGANSIIVNSGGTLSGTGTFGTAGHLTTIASGGTLSPGNSVGVVTNAGSHTFLSGSIYRLEENGYTTSPYIPSIDLLIVDQTAVVNGGSRVDLVTTNGFINMNTKQIFLTADGGLTVNAGGFALDTSGLSSLFNPNSYTSTLSYDANNYYILTQTQLYSVVKNNGGDRTAAFISKKLDGLVDPTTSQNFLLNDLAKLSGPDLVYVLDDMSGVQYATESFFAQSANRQFIRRLYDPIRAIVTTSPCNVCFDPCNELNGFDVWAEGGGGQRRVNGDFGAHLNEWDITLGLQKTFINILTVGVAGSYERNYLKYNRSNGSANGYSWFAGLYGLYRPTNYYVLADIAYGYSEHNVDRHLVIGNVTDKFKAKPKNSQVTFYAEGGIDQVLCSVLIQPFIGLEVAGFYRKGFSEREVVANDTSLTIHQQNNTSATSSLGLHLTDQFFSWVDVSIDLAWLYRFTKDYNFNANFQSFSATFPVYARKIGRSSGQGAITVSKTWNDYKVYVEGSGEIWNKASIYNVLAGIELAW
jgi:uncharacterized protein with beta-barrel porin domain